MGSERSTSGKITTVATDLVILTARILCSNIAASHFPVAIPLAVDQR